jgi:hypothetical protein
LFRLLRRRAQRISALFGAIRLTLCCSGRDFRLTDVQGEVVREILA